MHTPQPQEIYRHFKGKLYQVLTLARHSETGEKLVVYQALYGDYAVFARPLSLFCSEVDHARYPEAEQRERFRRIHLPEEPGMALTEGQQEAEARVVPEEQQEPEARVVPEGQQGAEARAVPEWQQEAEELHLDPRLIQFLDADRMEEKMEILDSLQSDITDDMIDIMALSLDAEIIPGEVSDRLLALRDTIQMRLRFESSRLRE